MNPSAFGSGFGYSSFGLGFLAVGTDFTCVDKAGNRLPICFGIGAENHRLFQTLQQTVNAFASEAGFVPLVVDGFIGELTVDAVNKLVPVFQEVGSTFGGGVKEGIASSALDLLQALNHAIELRASQGLTRTPSGTPVEPTARSVAAAGLPQTTAASVAAIVTAAAADASKIPVETGKKSLLPWILGGIAAVLAVGGIGYVYYRRQAKAGWGDADWDEDEDEDDEDEDVIDTMATETIETVEQD